MTAPSLAELDEIPVEAIPATIARLAARVMVPATPVVDDVLTVRETARLLHVADRWVYRRRRDLGGKKLGRKTLRFSRRKVLRWLSEHR